MSIRDKAQSSVSIIRTYSVAVVEEEACCVMELISMMVLTDLYPTFSADIYEMVRVVDRLQRDEFRIELLIQKEERSVLVKRGRVPWIVLQVALQVPVLVAEDQVRLVGIDN